MKIEVLFKEYPWLLNLNPLMDKMKTFTVSRLDMEMLVKKRLSYYVGSFDAGWAGLSPHDDVQMGWLIDSDGKILSKLHPELSSFSRFCYSWKRFIPLYSLILDCLTIYEAGKSLPKPELVKYVVFMKHYVRYGNSGDPVFEVDFIKMPKEKDFADVLFEYEAQIKNTRLQKEKEEECEAQRALSQI